VSDEYGTGPVPPPGSPGPPSFPVPPPPVPGSYPPSPYPGGSPYFQPPMAPGYGAGPPPLASYGARLGGWLIDWVLLGIVAAPFLIVTHSIHRTHNVLLSNGSISHQSGFSVGPAGIAIQALIVLAYGALLCGSTRGQTVGMMIVRVRAIDEARGGPIGYSRALGRAAFEYLMAVLIFIPWIVDMLFPLWDPSNQTLHDKVTRTVVVKI
jgi:uncharacterized RDD family membrane protein YckC